MKIADKIKPKSKFKLEPGFKQFLIKMGIFVTLIFIIQLLTMKLSTQTILPGNLIPIYLVDLAKVGLFVIVLFFVAYRKKLTQIKEN